MKELQFSIRLRQLKSYEREAISSHFTFKKCTSCQCRIDEDTINRLDHLFLCLSDEEFKVLDRKLNNISRRFVVNKFEKLLLESEKMVASTTPTTANQSPQETRPTTPEFKHNLVEELMGIHHNEDEEDAKLHETLMKPFDMMEDEIIEEVNKLNPEDGKQKLRQLNEHLSREKAKLAQIVDQFNPSIRDLVKEVCRSMLSEDLISRSLPEEIKQTKTNVTTNYRSSTLPHGFRPSNIANMKQSNSVPVALNESASNSVLNQREYIRQLINRNNLGPQNHMDIKTSVNNLSLPTMRDLQKQSSSTHISLRAQHAPVYHSVLKSPLDINSSSKSSHLPVIQQQQIQRQQQQQRIHQQLSLKRKSTDEHALPSKSIKMDEIQPPEHLIKSLLQKTQQQQH